MIGANKIPECTFLPDFDMPEFINAGLSLSIVSFIWMPPDSVSIRVDTRNPVRQDWEAVSAICRWADRTDPGEIKRKMFYQRMWDERSPGQDMVVFDRMIETSDELEAASDEG
jgi:hypothetical protein